MGRNNSDFNEPMKLWRGVPVSPDKVDYNQVGVHWTRNKGVAESFANKEGAQGTVLHGLVPRDALLSRKTAEGKYLHHILDVVSYGGEQEHTVRPGAAVQVVGTTHQGRTESFKEAKEATAHVFGDDPSEMQDELEYAKNLGKKK